MDMVDKHCCPDVVLLTVRCRPLFLPREFTTIIIMAVYILPQAKAKLALEKLHDSTNKQLISHQDCVIIVAGDSNYTDLKLVPNCPYSTRM